VEIFPSGRSRNLIARYVGVSGRTLEKAKRIVEAAEKQPDLYQPILEKVANGSISIDRGLNGGGLFIMKRRT